MRFGIFIDDWREGGIAVFLDRLEQRFTTLGHEVFIFLAQPHPKGWALGKQLYDRLKARLGERCIPLNLLTYPEKWRAAQLAGALAERRIECLLANQFVHYVTDLEEVSQLVPIISIAHTDSEQYYRELILSQAFTKKHVSVSRFIHQKCERFIPPEHKSRLKYIPYGVEVPDAFVAVPRGPLRIIYCSRIDSYQKRSLDLIPIWEAFCARGGQAELVVIGNGIAFDKFQSAFEPHVKTGTVRLLGHISPGEAASEMAKGDVILNLSNFEGLPQTVLEGVSLGLTPLLSDIESGHREIIENIGEGKILHIGDTAGFADTLLDCQIQLSNLRARRKSVRERAFQHYNFENCVNAYAGMLQEVALNNPRNPNSPAKYRPSINDRLKRFRLIRKYRV